MTSTAPGCSTLLATCPSRKKRVWISPTSDRELGVEHLHGDPLAVVRMGGRVHRRHATYTDELVEPPLVLQRATDSLLRALDAIVGLIH